MQAKKVWDSLIAECKNGPLNLTTKTGLHFTLTTDSQTLIVNKSDLQPSSKIKNPRKITKANFFEVSPFYKRWLDEEKGLSNKIIEKSRNSVYIMAAIKYQINLLEKKDANIVDLQMNEKYPIGNFQFKGDITSSVINNWINEIETLPLSLREAVKDLNDAQLNTAYRDGGWTVRQVVHHIADSHMNAYVRFKLALTEDNPVIKPYDEAKWADLSDYNLPIEPSLVLLESLHKRWSNLLRSLTQADLKKTFVHPDSGEVSIGENIGIYAWHGKHHVAHIMSLCERKNW